MTAIELMADFITRDLELLKWTLADFSDADMMVRPCPDAKHALWQLGHLVSSETFMVSEVKAGAMPALPAGFNEKFDGKTTGVDDAKALMPKAHLLELLDKARAASAEWVRGLKEEDLGKPAPQTLQAFAPTVGHVVLMLNTHLMMHLGQMQVIRRKLGKKVLY